MKRPILALIFTAASVIAVAQQYTYNGQTYDYQLTFPSYYSYDNMGWLYDASTKKLVNAPLTVYISRQGSVCVCEGNDVSRGTFSKDEIKNLTMNGLHAVALGWESASCPQITLSASSGQIQVRKTSYTIAVATADMKQRVQEIVSAALGGHFFTSSGTSSSTSSSSTSGPMTAERKKAILDNLIANMVRVEGGTFTMGATPEQSGVFYDNEKPIHQVTLSSFSICRYEVTQEEWDAVMGSNPSVHVGPRLPVHQISWMQCQTFIRKLNVATGKRFRLPTEAEWEYAARGGNLSNGYRFSGGNDLNQVGWNSANSRDVGEESPDYGPHPVGTRQPNELGLYDMSGNVSEWCQDWETAYRGGMQTNPKGAASGRYRIYRGGDWYNQSNLCRVSWRGSGGPGLCEWSLGFRLAW